MKISKQKAKVDKHIQKHADERVIFTVVSEELGVLNLDAAVGDLFDNLTLVYMDSALKEEMELGRLYDFSAVPFKGACEPAPMYMFAAGVDPTSDDLFNFDEDKDYESIMCYAFPIEKLQDWIVKPSKKPIDKMAYQVPDNLDIQELTDLLEDGIEPKELDKWLRDHGATPLTKEN